MNKLAELLRLLARGAGMDEAWKDSGFPSIEAAQSAILKTAASIEADDRPAAPDRGGASTRAAGTLSDVIVYADGACRGNPGPAAVAAIAYLPSGDQLTSASRKIGRSTNNVAEYKAVIEGLALARNLGAANVVVRLDSQLVVRQLIGEYRIKSEDLRPLADAVRAEASRFSSCAFEHVPRKENTAADRLANKALDSPEGGDGR
jgi:ribonuclease HI